VSKQSDAKARMGYTKQPMNCASCAFLSFEVVVTKGVFKTYHHHKHLRCMTGGFAVSKLARCNEWKPKMNEEIGGAK
jgi:ribosomal protein L37E